jgi:hypothetical protein
MKQQNVSSRHPMPEAYKHIVAMHPHLASNPDMMLGLAMAEKISRTFASVGKFLRELTPSALAHR